MSEEEVKKKKVVHRTTKESFNQHLHLLSSLKSFNLYKENVNGLPVHHQSSMSFWASGSHHQSAVPFHNLWPDHRRGEWRASSQSFSSKGINFDAFKQLTSWIYLCVHLAQFTRELSTFLVVSLPWIFGIWGPYSPYLHFPRQALNLEGVFLLPHYPRCY